MQDESYEADRRGDADALESLVALANKIEHAPDAPSRTRNQAREFARRVREVILKYSEAEDQGAAAGADVRGATP